MAEKTKNIALSYILKAIGQNSLKPPRTLFSGGVSVDAPFFPEDILVWKSSSERTVSDVSIHQRMILKIILSGSVTTILDGLRIPMKASDMILFFPFQFHSTRLLCPPSDYSFLAITFVERTRNYTPLLPLKNHLLTPDDHDAGNIADILRAYLRQEHSAPETGVLSLMELLFTQRRKVLSSESAAAPSPAPGEIADRISDYFRSNFNRQISLKSAAAEFGVSENTIRRLFRKSYGEITPGSLIRRLRMQFAIEMLEHTEESIAEVAKKCGYSDPFVFSRAFKNLTGMSPLQHRSMVRNLSAGRAMVSNTPAR